MISAFRDRLWNGFLYQSLRFFRLSGSRERSARGFAIGLACNFYPTFGIGGFIAIFVAKLLGGNVAAAFLGGCALAFFWPLLFYLNIRMGSLLVTPPMMVDDYADVTPQAVSALVWGRTFLWGSVINSLLAATLGYLGFGLLHERIRPTALRWLRRKIRERGERFTR